MMSNSPDSDLLVYFVVPRQLVKRMKTALEKQRKADPLRKIRPCSVKSGDPSSFDGKHLIPSTFNFEDGENFLLDEGLSDEVHIIVQRVVEDQDIVSKSVLEIAVQEWYSKLNLELLQRFELSLLLQQLPKTYSIYGPMLLLPQHAFQTELWQDVLKSISREQSHELFQSISICMKVSHIATNAPIPLHNLAAENVVRSPTELTPLFGDFGTVCTSVRPTPEDFAAAFWCFTKQNGIVQYWAPRYTMFSRGNITEKARVLKMPSVAKAVSQTPDTGCCAVDLYTGIGYFTFSYLAAGVKTVLGWDLNPWSIEGLRRGAVANKWTIEVHQRTDKTQDIATNSRLIAFVESNEFALTRIEKLRHALPPIRHVNCGLLPTSKDSYATAIAALDPKLGGWIHVHENFALSEIEEMAENVRLTFQQLLQSLESCHHINEPRKPGRNVALEHVQRVKSYAPGVFHCVVDLFVGPILQ